MRETEERRRLVQQHMANLKRQRGLEAERNRMAKEEDLAWALIREEKRYVVMHTIRKMLSNFHLVMTCRISLACPV